jgi:hypothetical protein
MLVGMLGALLLVHDRARERARRGGSPPRSSWSSSRKRRSARYSWSIAPAQIYGKGRPDITMPFGSFVNHNHFAGFVEMGAILALGMSLGHLRRARALTPRHRAPGREPGAGRCASREPQPRGLLSLTAGVMLCGGLCAGLWSAAPGSQARRRVLVGVAAAA